MERSINQGTTIKYKRRKMGWHQGFPWYLPTPFTVSVGNLRGGGRVAQNFLRGGGVGLPIYGPEGPEIGAAVAVFRKILANFWKNVA